MKRKIFLFLGVAFLAVQSLYGQIGDINEGNIDQVPRGEEKVEALLNFAWTYKSSDSDKALLYAKQALEISKELTHQKLTADANHSLGLIYWYKGDFQNATKYLFDALYIRELIHDELGLSRSYNNIGNILFSQKDYEGALKYYRNGLNLRKKLKDSTGLIYSYNNLGDIFSEQGFPTKAKRNYFRALDIAQAKGHRKGEAFVLYRLGVLYHSYSNPDSAKVVLNKSLNLANTNNDKDQVAKNLVVLASIDINHENFQDALDKAMEAREISEKLGAKKTMADACSELALAYAGEGQYEDAYRENLVFNKLNAELSSAEIEKALKETQYNYEGAKKDLEISEQKRKLSQNRFFILGFAFVIVMLIAFMLYSNYREQQKRNERLELHSNLVKEQNEALLRSNTALEQFAYIASHDLKEPLRNINTYSFLLSENLKGVAKETAKEYLDLIAEGTAHMNQLLLGILSYSRLTQSALSLNETVNLNDSLEKVKETLGGVINEKNVVFEVDDLPIIRSNKMQMYQLFQNIISNAIKFNDKEVPKIQILYHQKEDGHHFEFIDNGIGFNERYKQKIFQIFQRLEGKQYSGTGVGMAICKKIIEQHGGTIDVSSVEGEGTTFFIHIPFMDPSENDLIL